MTLKVFILYIVFITFTKPVFAGRSETLQAFCSSSFALTTECPMDWCHLTCQPTQDKSGCSWLCLAKPCTEISANKCPLDYCQVLPGCGGKNVCYPKFINEPTTCGDVAYGGKLECCEGYVKRCGIEFFDHKCDMVGAYTEFSIPICLPCGNGLCNQFENQCNCPEDCLPFSLREPAGQSGRGLPEKELKEREAQKSVTQPKSKSKDGK